MHERLIFHSPRELFAARWEIVRLSLRAGGTLAGGLVLVNVLLGALPVLFVIATSVVLGRVPAAVETGLSGPAWDSLVSIFLLAAAAFVAQQMVAPLAASLSELMARRVDGPMFRELMSASLRTPGITALEDPRVLGDLRVASTELQFGLQSPGQACAGMINLISKYLQLAGYAVVVGMAFSWIAAGALVTVVLLFRYGQRGGLRKFARDRLKFDALELELDYLRQLTIQPAAGKEIRIFGLAGWLQRRFRTTTLGFLGPMWKVRRRVYMWPFVWFAGWGLLATGAVFAGIGAMPAESFTLTGFVLVIQSTLAALRLSEYYPESDLQTTVGMFAYDSIRRFESNVAALDRAAPRPETPDTAEVPMPRHAIHFDRVTFHYPGNPAPVFDRLDLTIPVGRCTAVVGLNGAGKTTLVKLLARLYEPDDGAIRVDGVDIRSYPVQRWRDRLGVIFQQFIRFEATAAENVALGSVAHLDDAEGVREAVDAVGLGTVLNGLPRGLDTPLARHLTGGAELSGGQWQRVALARALFALRHGAPVVVLDEPTASLDVRAEARFFGEFAQLTRGATTILISHRFSTVRHADLIVVLDQGRIAEQGDHESLLAAGGRYAELFRLQANRFHDADTGDAEAVPT